MSAFFRSLGLSLWISAGLGSLSAPAQANLLGPFDQALSTYTADGALDGREYALLRQIPQQGVLPAEDRSLAGHFLDFAAKHTAFVQMTYSYHRGRQRRTLQFAFAPTYAEDSLITGSSPREVLGKISQNDILPETQNDRYRCGAAALLGAHYLLYGSFDAAFARLGIQTSGVSYRAMHLAQDQLYTLVNSDRQPGLVSMFRYTIYGDGRVGNPVSDGEILHGATLLGLKLHPLIGETKVRFYQRQKTVQSFWKMYPDAALLLGVHLDEKNGTIYAPSEPRYPQNHFVLAFREGKQIWLANSGVLNNGTGQALVKMTPQQVDTFIYNTTGTLEAVTRN
ncbi:MAG: hypothetical protein ACO1RX_09775 [Candidatus Sericytochromatia bacterium]